MYATHSEPNWSLPWQRKRQFQSTSSGFIIAGRRVLTNAHSVAHHSQVKLKHRGSEVKYLARVLSIGSECDLALLTVDDPAFWASVTPVKLGRLPRLQASCLVVGYPIGGETLSVTAGVVSRIEMTAYAHSSAELLGIQIDAAINSGNSGGPVFSDDGSCVGVAFQSLGKGEDADGIGYIIPTPVIEHFLSDFAAHRAFTGFPILGLEYQTMESGDLRKALGLSPTQKGVLVRGVEPTGSTGGLLKRGDVLLEFDGQPIAVDGTVPFRVGERIGFSHLVSGKQVGDTARLKIFSDRKEKTLTVTLRPPNRLLPVSPHKTSYYVFGGVVFLPASVPYLRSEYGTHYDFDAPVRLLEKLLHGAKKTDDEDAVVLAHVLAHECNLGYETLVNVLVLAVNGTPVHNLAQLAQLIEATAGPYVLIDLDHGQLLALDAAAARAASQSILETHSIAKRCSPDIEEALGGGAGEGEAAGGGRGGRKRRNEEAREEAGAASPEASPPEEAERPASRRGQGRR